MSGQFSSRRECGNLFNPANPPGRNHLRTGQVLEIQRNFDCALPKNAQNLFERRVRLNEPGHPELRRRQFFSETGEYAIDPMQQPLWLSPQVQDCAHARGQIVDHPRAGEHGSRQSSSDPHFVEATIQHAERRTGRPAESGAA
jgi:hypothetical protein